MRLTFDVRASLRPGERLYVSGNTPSLGDANPALGAPAQRVEAGRWRVSFEAPAARALRFQFHGRNPDGSSTAERSADERRRRWVPSAAGNAVMEISATF